MVGQGGTPTELKLPENTLRMGHHGGESAILGRDSGETALAAVGVGRVALRRRTPTIHKTHHLLHPAGIPLVLEVGKALPVGHGNGVAKPLEAFEENAL